MLGTVSRNLFHDIVNKLEKVVPKMNTSLKPIISKTEIGG